MMMLKTSLPFLRKLTFALLILIHIIHAVTSTFYVYAALAALLSSPLAALLVALLMGLGNLVILLLIAFNTLREKEKALSPPQPLQANGKLQTFVGVVMIALALHLLSNGIGPYLSLTYLGTALSLPIHTPWFMAIVISIATLSAITFLLYELVQFTEVYEYLLLTQHNALPRFTPLHAPTVSNALLTTLPQEHSIRSSSLSSQTSTEVTAAQPFILTPTFK